ncbi:hypothetical protein NP493_1713g00007 [Ridgeia piscesae]|uniref:Uncharacterized protein n=1 Tax=Ridgeia piscesae TaxID=27915 RepID=A0AAD9JUF0_RIDPI|nr:hypothetical protein NP493_1713g00007 [Ridgeia piscesae]
MKAIEREKQSIKSNAIVHWKPVFATPLSMGVITRQAKINITFLHITYTHFSTINRLSRVSIVTHDCTACHVSPFSCVGRATDGISLSTLDRLSGKMLKITSAIHIDCSSHGHGLVNLVERTMAQSRSAK